MLTKILSRWANRKLQREVEKLQANFDAERRRLAVANAEIESLAGVVARDRMRVASECAIAARTKADAEGTTHERAN